MSSAIGSAWKRRAAKTSASADGGSSHWASSTQHSTGPRVAGLGQQAQQAGGDQEAVLHGVEAQAQRAAQRRGLGGGQAVDELEARPHQLVHARRTAARTRPRCRRSAAPSCRRARRRRTRAARSCRCRARRAARARRCAHHVRSAGAHRGRTARTHARRASCEDPNPRGRRTGRLGGGLGGHPIRPWAPDRSLAAMSCTLQSPPSPSPSSPSAGASRGAACSCSAAASPAPTSPAGSAAAAPRSSTRPTSCSTRRCCPRRRRATSSPATSPCRCARCVPTPTSCSAAPSPSIPSAASSRCSPRRAASRSPTSSS